MRFDIKTMKQTLFNKAKNDLWVDDEVSMTITARSGTGGGNLPIILAVHPIRAKDEPGFCSIRTPSEPYAPQTTNG